MTTSHNFAANTDHKSSKIETFITKAPHEVTLTDTDSRVFIKNIKSGVTLDQFKQSLEKYGDIQVYLYEPGNKDDGWAWVGFDNKEAALRIVEESDIKSEENNEKDDSVHDNDDEKQDSNSFYAENEENKQQEDE